MARSFNGILGDFSGTIGPIVGCRFGDTFYLRSRPRKRSVAPTEKLLASRAAFVLLQHWLHPLKAVLQCGFKNYGTKTGGMRAAISLNYKAALAGAYPAYSIDVTKVRLSGGELPLPDDIQVGAEAAAEGIRLRFTWRDNQATGTNPFDQAMPVAYNTTKGIAVYKTTGNFRQDGEDSLEIPGSWTNDSVHLWLAFSAADRNSQSESVYLGEMGA